MAGTGEVRSHNGGLFGALDTEGRDERLPAVAATGTLGSSGTLCI
jgi:hypothetical protein